MGGASLQRRTVAFTTAFELKSVLLHGQWNTAGRTGQEWVSAHCTRKGSALLVTCRL